VTWFEDLLKVRRARQTGMALVFVTLAAAAIAIGIRLYPLAVLDGVMSLPSLILEDTGYAEGYSHAKFRTIRPGMTETQVREALGAPLGAVWKDQSPQPALGGGDMRLWYSMRQGSQSYRIREIEFCAGRVRRIRSGVYAD
jgi:hypothetical protein